MNHLFSKAFKSRTTLAATLAALVFGHVADASALPTFRLYAKGVVTSSAPPAGPLVYTVLDSTSNGCLAPTFSSDKLTYSCPGGSVSVKSVKSVAGKTSGKWYWEVVPSVANSEYTYYGVSDVWPVGYAVGSSAGVGYYGNNAYVYVNGTTQSDGLSHVNLGDTVSVLLDMDGHTVSFKYNCGATKLATATLNAGPHYAVVSPVFNTAQTYTANFGSTAFKCAIPAGYTGLAQ